MDCNLHAHFFDLMVAYIQICSKEIILCLKCCLFLHNLCYEKPADKLSIQ